MMVLNGTNKDIITIPMMPLVLAKQYDGIDTVYRYRLTAVAHPIPSQSDAFFLV